MTETLKFKVEVTAEYWNKVPEYLISIHDANSNFVAGMTESCYISGQHAEYEFDASLVPGTYSLRVALLNKGNGDTVVEQGKIVKDLRLNVHRVSIGGVDLHMLIQKAGVYLLDKPQEFDGQIITRIPGAINMGWNGYYSLIFTSPYYHWLLENL